MFEKYFPTIVTLLGVLALVSVLEAVLSPLLNFRIPAGAAEYIHWTPEEVMLRYLEIGCFVAIGIVDLFIAIGFFLRLNRARLVALVLSPVPLIGTVLAYGGVISLLTGEAYLFRTVGISFPALAPLIFPIIARLTGSATLDIGFWFGIVNFVFLALGFLNLLLPFFLVNKQVKALFQRKTSTSARATARTDT